MCESNGTMFIHTGCCGGHWAVDIKTKTLICAECRKPFSSRFIRNLDIIMVEYAESHSSDGGVYISDCCASAFELSLTSDGQLHLCCDKCDQPVASIIHESIDVSKLKCSCCDD